MQIADKKKKQPNIFTAINTQNSKMEAKSIIRLHCRRLKKPGNYKWMHFIDLWFLSLFFFVTW